VATRAAASSRRSIIYDVTRPDAAGFADSAAKDRTLTNAVAAHKSSFFFAESMPNGAPIDYRAAVTGALADARL